MKNFTLLKIACLVLILSVRSVSAQIPSNGLVGYFPFNGNANDQSGSGIIGTPKGDGYPVGPAPGLTADRNAVANSAYEFVQCTSYSTTLIDLGMHSVFNFDSTSSFSVSLWMKYAVYQTSPSMIGNDQWHLGIRRLGGQDHLNLVVGTTSFNSDSLLYPGAWVHVAGVYNRANKTMEVYINGELRTGFSYNGFGPYGPQGQPSQNTANCAVCVLNSMPSVATQIGILSAIPTNFTGVLDDILFYNRALSGSEVGDIYEATGGPTGIEEAKVESYFTVGSNPAHGIFNVRVSSVISEEVTLKAYAMDGRLVMEQRNISDQQQIDLSPFGNGNYLLKLETSTGFHTQKVSVVR